MPIIWLSLILIWLVSVIMAIPAIVCGHMALYRFRNRDGRNMRGRWYAYCGMSMGYMTVLIVGWLLYLRGVI